ncbi:MAG: metallophosphoesterase [Ignavibacteriales bacterium]|nr:metallophosphoesterase [Ignavibacteriales bacterium]
MILLCCLSLLVFTNYGLNQETGKTESIIIVGDTQRTSKWEIGTEQNKDVAKKIFDRIAEENPTCVVHLGDMVFYGSSKRSWASFDSDAASIIKDSIPIYPVPGNHEYFGNNKAALSNLYQHFPILKDQTWYSRQINKLGIIFLNSNFANLSKSANKLQLDWYKNELVNMENDSTIERIVVVCHHPPYTNSTVVSESKEVQKYFVQPFITAKKTELFFSGHCHSVEHFVKDNKHFIVSGGGGGPRQKLKVAAKWKYKDLHNGGRIRNFNYCKISFSDNEINLEIIGWDDAIKERKVLFGFQL